MIIQHFFGSYEVIPGSLFIQKIISDATPIFPHSHHQHLTQESSNIRIMVSKLGVNNMISPHFFISFMHIKSSIFSIITYAIEIQFCDSFGLIAILLRIGLWWCYITVMLMLCLCLTRLSFIKYREIFMNLSNNKVFPYKVWTTTNTKPNTKFNQYNKHSFPFLFWFFLYNVSREQKKH